MKRIVIPLKLQIIFHFHRFLFSLLTLKRRVRRQKMSLKRVTARGAQKNARFDSFECIYIARECQ